MVIHFSTILTSILHGLILGMVLVIVAGLELAVHLAGGGVKGRKVRYPPAKPGALRLLAPQRGLIAIGQNQSREFFTIQSFAKVLVVVIPAKAKILNV